MVVDNLDIFGVRAGPCETHAPLRVDTNAVLAFTVAFQGFEPVAGRHFQVTEAFRTIQHGQFANGGRLDIRETLHALAGEQGLRVGALEALDRHIIILTHSGSIVNRYHRAGAPHGGILFVIANRLLPPGARFAGHSRTALALLAPVLNWITIDDHLLEPVPGGYWPVAGVDLLLLSGAGIAVCTARRLARRADAHAPVARRQPAAGGSTG